jgi:hypothetical protein
MSRQAHPPTSLDTGASSPCAMSVSKILTATFERRPDLVLIRPELRSDGVAFLEVRDSYSHDPIQLRPVRNTLSPGIESRESDRVPSRIGNFGGDTAGTQCQTGRASMQAGHGERCARERQEAAIPKTTYHRLGTEPFELKRPFC